MNNLAHSVVAVCLFAGCSSPDRSILDSSAKLGQAPLVIVPNRPLPTPFHFSLLCVKVPANYNVESSSLRTPDNRAVVVKATLSATDGTKHAFTNSGCLQGGYICLQANPSVDRPGLYEEIEISSSVPFTTKDIRWISTDKL